MTSQVKIEMKSIKNDPDLKQVWDEALKEVRKSLQENNKRFIDSLKTIGHSLVNQHKDYNDIIIFSNLPQ